MQNKNKAKSKQIKITVLIIFFFIGLNFFYKFQLIIIHKNIVFAEKAKTLSARRQGLQYRKSMPQNQGMLFFFENEGCHNFWMKNTYLALDIAFIDKNKKILDIQQMVPLRDDLRYSIKEPYKYVLEMNAGWFKKHNISPGDKLSFW
ncbi:MAG: DUF192 domain-containing protein [Candidatus Omnitrophota bacterium]